jgi:hypothetical protein
MLFSNINKLWISLSSTKVFLSIEDDKDISKISTLIMITKFILKTIRFIILTNSF